jgi:hypothetical protein
LPLLELLWMAQPSATKLELPAKVTAPLAVWLSAMTQTGGPCLIRSAFDRAATTISLMPIAPRIPVLRRSLAVTVTVLPLTLAVASCETWLGELAVRKKPSATFTLASLLEAFAAAALRAAASVIC